MNRTAGMGDGHIREMLRMTSQHSVDMESLRAQHHALGEIMQDYLSRALEPVSVEGHEEKGAVGEVFLLRMA